MQNQVVAFIGCGNMLTSIVKGLLADGYPAQHLWATDISAERVEQLASLNINATTDNEKAIRAADVIVLGAKPQQMQVMATSIAHAVQEKQPLILSVAAGISVELLARWLGDGLAIVRSMPNTPALVNTGATGLFANDHVTAEQRSIAESIARAVGVAIWVDDEALIDVITAVSGSGPAYFFYFMEMMENVAIELGLPKQEANILVLQTALGASKLALESEDGAAELRRKVTSPGGTTQQALEVFTQRCPEIFKEAMTAAMMRAKELTEELGKEKS